MNVTRQMHFCKFPFVNFLFIDKKAHDASINFLVLI